MPAYRSSVFSLMTTRSTSGWREGTPGSERDGRTAANRSSSCRSATFTLRNPTPTGVVIGPLSATRVRRMESKIRSGSGVPSRARAAAPASSTAHSNPTPVASMTRWVASETSGPMPSPGIRVTRCATAAHYRTIRAGSAPYTSPRREGRIADASLDRVGARGIPVPGDGGAGTGSKGGNLDRERLGRLRLQGGGRDVRRHVPLDEQRHDQAHHDAERSAFAVWNSGHLNSGSSFSKTITFAGSYPYHFAIHSSMTGTSRCGSRSPPRRGARTRPSPSPPWSPRADP